MHPPVRKKRDAIFAFNAPIRLPDNLTDVMRAMRDGKPAEHGSAQQIQGFGYVATANEKRPKRA
jgi:hypothetical protein